MDNITSIPITFTADPLPEDFTGSLDDFQARFVQNLRGSISTDLVIGGRVGGSRPNTNIGPWLNKRTWYVWSELLQGYTPADIRVGTDGINSVLLAASPTANRKITLQDKDGVVALLSDVRIGGDAIVLTTTTPTIDWSLGNNFVETLVGNTTIKHINSRNGQEIWVLLRNTGTSYTVTWPSDIFWETTPSQTASAADLYILTNIGGTVVGRQIAGY